MKVDLLTPAQLAFVQALRAAFAGSVHVSHSLKQDIVPPYVLVGNIEAESLAQSGEQFEMLSIEIMTVYRGFDRAILTNWMHTVRSACDEVPLPAQDGILFGLPRYLGAAVSSPAEDGVTFAGITNFQVHVQPA